MHTGYCSTGLQNNDIAAFIFDSYHVSIYQKIMFFFSGWPVNRAFLTYMPYFRK